MILKTIEVEGKKVEIKVPETAAEADTVLMDLAPSMQEFMAKGEAGAAGLKAVQESLNGMKGFKAQLDAQDATINDLKAERKARLAGDTDATEEKANDFATIIKAAAGKGAASNKDVHEIYNKYGMTEAELRAGQEMGSGQFLVDGKAMSEGVAGAGGYTVPTTLATEVMRIPAQESIIWNQARRFPMSRETHKLINQATGFTITVEAENADIAAKDSTPTFGQPVLTAKRWTGYTKVSNDLLDDSAVRIGPYITEIAREAMGEKIDYYGFRGDTGAADPFMGILNTVGVNKVIMDAGLTDFINVNAALFSEMTSTIKPKGRPNAKFFIHRSIMHYVRILKDGQGVPIYHMNNGTGVQSIYGYPVVETEQMPTSSDSAAATPFIVFGNLKYYAVGDRKSFAVRALTEIAALTNQTYIVVMQRLGLVAAVPEGFCIAETAAA